jgi:hypothetical protein
MPKQYRDCSVCRENHQQGNVVISIQYEAQAEGQKRIRLGFKSSSTSRACISPHHPRIENAATSSASNFRYDFRREMHISVSRVS